MTYRLRGVVSVLGVVLLAAGAVRADQIVADFDDLTLAPNSHWAGDKNGTVVPGPYGNVSRNIFTSHGVGFINDHDLTYESWSGFAYSNHTDTTTAGYGNQFSAFTGTGHGPGEDNYGVTFGYTAGSTAADMLNLPTLILPAGGQIQGLYVTNTTYAGTSMRDGDQFAKKFGGASGNDQDWFKLTAYGTDAAGNLLSSSVEFYLADYRFDDNQLDYIVSDWRYLDLSSLAGAARIHFNLASSDNGMFGMNTPATFAVDDITYNLNRGTPVPEPSSLALLGLGAVAAGIVVRRRRVG